MQTWLPRLPVLLLLLGLGIAPARADIFAPGFSAEVWTINNDVFPQQAIKLDTPKDLDSVAAGSAVYEFAAEPAPPDFQSIQKIVVHRLATSYIGSQPEAMEFYSLGELTNAVPPPPDWKRVVNQIPPWSRAHVTTEMAHLPFLTHAIFCWTDGRHPLEGHDGVYIFRQELDIDHPEQVARVTLRLATNAELSDAALNEHPIHLGGWKSGAIVEYDVTRLIKAGQNILALQVHEKPATLDEKYGLAFHLEIVRRDGTATAPTDDPLAALVTNEDGDRLWGRPRDLRGDGVLLDTAYGLYKSEWTATTGVLFPEGWHTPAPPRNVMDELFSRPPAPPPPPERYGLPLDAIPQPLQDCLLLTAGRQTTAKPDYAQGDTLFFEGVEGQRYSAPLADVVGIYPPRPVSWTFKRPDPVAGMLFCRIDTTTGESVHGLLRQLNGRRAVVDTAVGQILNIPLDRIATIYFPYHRGPAPASIQGKGPIALIPQMTGQEAYQTTYLTDARLLQSAIFSIGASFANLPQDELANQERLTPQHYPVLVTVDPVGEYVHTLLKPGDAQDALVHYLTQGGVVVALSRGGAFRTATNDVQGRFVRSVVQPALTDLLGVRTDRPSDTPQAGITPFDHPPNSTEQIFFQRASALPEGLDGLPRRIELSPMEAAPFYPMVPTENQGKILYTLCDASGFVYGPALTMIPKGRGWVIIVDHLLWESHADEQSFVQQTLPLLLRWALVNAGQ